MPSDFSPIDMLRRELLAARNADGGWGYFAGKASRVEPTCWALLALASRGTHDTGQVEAHDARAWLLGCQRADGLLVDAATGSLNLAFNGLAAIALSDDTDSQSHAAADRIPGGLLGHRGVKAEQADILRQDNQLQGWPWIDNTFSWVEPTAWCVLALKKTARLGAAAAGRERVAEAERLLIDRTCQNGGWNYGNSNVFGKNLWPYVPTTAVGLLAMQDKRGEQAVIRSIGYLQGHQTTEVSGMALSLTTICLSVLGLPIAEAETLLARDVTRVVELGNLVTIALSLYALTISQHDAQAFRI